MTRQGRLQRLRKERERLPTAGAAALAGNVVELGIKRRALDEHERRIQASMHEEKSRSEEEGETTRGGGMRRARASAGSYTDSSSRTKGRSASAAGSPTRRPGPPR